MRHCRLTERVTLVVLFGLLMGLAGLARVARAGEPGVPPVLSNPFTFTEYFGPNEAPGFKSDYRTLALGVFVEVTDGDDIAKIVVTACHSDLAPCTEDQTLLLSYLQIGQIYSGLFQLEAEDGFNPEYEGQTGSWVITATDSDGDSAEVTTHELDKPLEMPLATNIVFSDSSTTPLITWDPVMIPLEDGGEPVEARYRVRFLRGAKDQFFREGPFDGSSFQVPPCTLTPGESVFLRIESWHYDDDALENRSSTFAAVTPDCVHDPNACEEPLDEWACSADGDDTGTEDVGAVDAGTEDTSAADVGEADAVDAAPDDTGGAVEPTEDDGDGCSTGTASSSNGPASLLLLLLGLAAIWIARRSRERPVH